MRTYRALFLVNLRLTLRDRTALFFNYLFPLIFFFALLELFRAGRGGGVSFFVATVLTMGILGNGLWGAGVRAVQERETNILRRFKVTPISPLPILLASMLSGWLLYMPVVALVIGLAHVLYGMPLPRQWPSLLVMVSLGVCSFRAIGLMLAAVANTMQEASVATQLLYLPMLFLSGATVPAAILPAWAQTIAEFMPASYLVSGFQGIFFRDQTVLDNLPSAAALAVSIALGLFLAVKLFRWEKGERIPARNKLWVAAVLGPFLLMGAYRSATREHEGDNQALYRELQRSGVFLVRGARIVAGTGTTLETGAVLVRDGKIAEIWGGLGPPPASLGADAIEGAGKTLMPGLIDVQASLSAFAGGAAGDDPDPRPRMSRAAAALLYSGVTAARVSGDGLAESVALRSRIAGGRWLGALLSVCGPVLASGPADQARRAVRELRAGGADALRIALDAGLEEDAARAAAAEARASGLSFTVRVADAAQAAHALDLGAAAIETAALADPLPDALLARMAKNRVYLVPSLAALEAQALYYAGQAPALDESLVEQTVRPVVVDGARRLLASGSTKDPAKAAHYARALETARENLLRAWKAGVRLATGSGAGAPLVFHGPSLHHELELWVRAGIPAGVALQAATGEAAALLRIDSRAGAIQKGRDADLLLLDGNPLTDIQATERISLVVFKGERLRRSALFEQK